MLKFTGFGRFTDGEGIFRQTARAESNFYGSTNPRKVGGQQTVYSLHDPLFYYIWQIVQKMAIGSRP
ncbi:hypothetical protein CRP01_18095 [Flavilitoribacter nigricans DSM 23189 = NBRC 102662]|uniref:Uncharacterized protein n=1 Tax=Flavilitoribacter nigricans (strain ATCC 23147 / DSM 23189 / NBRC 102662 / NCIMB 1420 / SS-2) TaxID=1122177 RepID=A0A2D0NAZ6_FLAN2|nr:hypothetical protein CRP01_18095 [Flavilitoribacter nigricans DSM 23189 = NBRC 102662]